MMKTKLSKYALVAALILPISQTAPPGPAHAQRGERSSKIITCKFGQTNEIDIVSGRLTRLVVSFKRTPRLFTGQSMFKEPRSGECMGSADVLKKDTPKLLVFEFDKNAIPTWQNPNRDDSRTPRPRRTLVQIRPELIAKGPIYTIFQRSERERDRNGRAITYQTAQLDFSEGKVFRLHVAGVNGRFVVKRIEEASTRPAIRVQGGSDLVRPDN